MPAINANIILNNVPQKRPHALKGRSGIILARFATAIVLPIDAVNVAIIQNASPIEVASVIEKLSISGQNIRQSPRMPNMAARMTVRLIGVLRNMRPLKILKKVRRENVTATRPDVRYSVPE